MSEQVKRDWSRVLYPVAVFFVCALVYYLVLEGFLSIPILNADTQVRPASGLGPVLGLFFGVPAILGCALANIIADMAVTTDPATLLTWFTVQVIYNATPYLLWYVIFRKRAYPFPRLDSAGKLVAYLCLAIFDALLVSTLLIPFEPATMVAFDIHLIHALNNIVFLVYLGIPLLILLDRLPIHPLPPPWVSVAYVQRAHMNLTQKVVLAFTAAAAVATIGIVALLYAPNLTTDSTNYAQLIGDMYVSITRLTLLVLAPLLLVVRFFEHRLTKPLEVLTQAALDNVNQVEGHDDGQGEFVAKPLCEKGIHPRDEMRLLFDATNEMNADLARYLNELSAVTAEREKAAAELDIAHRIQLSAVPREFKQFDERHSLGVNGFIRPAREVGGDFYEVFEMDERRVAFVIGDVSGKGVPAALFMMRAQSLIKEHLLTHADMGLAITQVNRELCERNDAMLFVTVFACVLDTSTGQVSYVNAGHNPPSILREGQREYLACRPGFVLGGLESITYRVGTIELKPGDGVVLYTDGVTEACNAAEELYGEARLECLLKTCDLQGEQDVLNRVVADVDAFAGEAPQADDITLLSFSWNLPVQCLDVPPEDRYLDDLFAFLEQFCTREGCTPAMLPGLMLVCEEIFINVCHYGFPEDTPRFPVRFEAAADDRNHCLHLMILDRGVAYNPLQYEHELIRADREHRIGGLGIFLVKQNVDDISYERANGKNILRITKGYV
ncbi:MAG: SpoIIE family protein phosphatase [Clostridia bacterium]